MKLRFASWIMVIASAGLLAAETRQVVFEGAVSEHKWTLKDLNPDLRSDWTGYDYLVLEMRASSPQRFMLNIYSKDLVQSRRMQPLANAWIRTAVPLVYFRRPNRQGFDQIGRASCRERV